ncbi:MAG: hypothetical protein H0V64_13630 [Geodermatophilaceae bacterium]|nr:hypothetical protein [Geodermatophilaceae bacterium]MDQ3464001.1 hypothetical protein [Actinomycetota bacterium]
MRTTVSIDDALLAEAKAAAVRTGRPLGAVVDDALRVLFNPGRAERATGGVRLPTDGGSGVRPGVDLEDKEQLADILGENEPPHAAG